MTDTHTDSADDPTTPATEAADVSSDLEHDEAPEPADVGMLDIQAVIHDELTREEAAEADSHTELDPSVYHASSIGYPIRQAYLSKLGLKQIDADTLGTFKTGTLIHEYIEQAFGNSDAHGHIETEKAVRKSVGDITFTGHCDAYDPENGVVYDFKTRASWYRFDPPTQRHIDQLLVYMFCLGAPYGQVAYVSKGDMEVRTWPEDGPFSFADNSDRFRELVSKAHRIRQAIVDNGYPSCEADIPFPKGSDWLSRQEQLVGWME